jgi:hypothetical protein
MKRQVDISEMTEELLEAHRKLFFPHLNKRAYIVEMARQRAEKDMEDRKK